MENSVERETEFDRVKRLLEKVEYLGQQKKALLQSKIKYRPDVVKQALLTLNKNEEKWIKQVIMSLKQNFKHIYGMWPSTAHFSDENHRMHHWLTDLVIKRKIFDPSKRLIACK